jgi:hypothetical protein
MTGVPRVAHRPTSESRCACGNENTAAAKFCTACGGSLAAVCHPCGQRNPRDARFCNYCGVSLPGGSRIAGH